MTTQELVRWINELIEKDELWRFYKSKEFRHLAADILKEDHKECCICGKPNATTVHHNQFVRKHPELALSRYYYYNGKKYRNLISVCKTCHNKLHPEKLKRNKIKKCITEERF